MPRLLQINTSLNVGSTGRISEQIGSRAMLNGWESVIVHGPRFKQESKSRALQTISLFEEKLHIVKSLLLDKHGLGSAKQTQKVINSIKLINPDIIHLHNLHGYYLNYKILFEFLSTSKIPIVWTLHDCWAFTGHCAYFDMVNCRKWENQCFECPLRLKYPKSIIFDNSKDNYSLKKRSFTSVSNMTMVPVSNWIGDLLGSSFLKYYPVKVIHNGIDINSFDPKYSIDLNEKFGTKEKIFILAVALQWDKRKGKDELCKLSFMLSEKFRVIMVGITSKQAKKFAPNVIAVPRTNSVHDLAVLYASADVFINPTLEDNFPTTNLEALACGTPVVTYQTGGSPEAIDKSTGVVVSKGDLNGLKMAIERIVQEGKGLYIDKCRERAVRLFNKDDRFDDYIKLYKSLLNGL